MFAQQLTVMIACVDSIQKNCCNVTCRSLGVFNNIPSEAYYEGMATYLRPLPQQGIARGSCQRSAGCTFTLRKDGRTIKFVDRAGLLTMVGELVEKAFEEDSIALSSNFGYGDDEQFFSHDNAQDLFRSIEQGVHIMQRIDCIVDDVM